MREAAKEFGHGGLDPGVEMIAKPFTFQKLGGRIRALLDRPEDQ
jgi:hypothetical protein